MKRTMGIGISVCLMIAAILATRAGAVDSSPNETAQELVAAAEDNVSHPWSATIDQSLLPASNIRTGNGTVTMGETGVKLARLHVISPDLTLSSYLAYSLRSIDAPAGARLPDSLHTVAMGVGGDYRINNDLYLNFLVAPSLNSDFGEIGMNDVRAQAGLLGRYNVTKRLTLMAGLIYLQGFRSIPVLPIVGAIYRPDEEWTIRLAAPRPGVTYSPDKVSSYYVGAEFTGSEYQLHDAAIGAGIINYRDFRAVAGMERLLFSAIRVSITGGYVFDRRFVFYDSARKDVTVDNSAFVKLGVSTAW